jgi:hypothetical protein
MHLTRDHSFDEPNVQPLTIDEQAKLHAAERWGLKRPSWRESASVGVTHAIL